MSTKARKTKKTSAPPAATATSAKTALKKNHPLAEPERTGAEVPGPEFVYVPSNVGRSSSLPEAVGVSPPTRSSDPNTSALAQDALGASESTPTSAFDLPDVTGKTWQWIIGKYGYKVTQDGNLVLHKNNSYMQVEKGYSFFNGRNFIIKYADYNNNTLTMKLILTEETAANLRAIQNAWVTLYYKLSDELAKADTRFVEISKWKRKIKNAWRDYHEDKGEEVPPLPENWRDLWSHPSMMEDKSGKDGNTYKVNMFFADKIIQRGDQALLKVDWSAGDSNCGPTIRAIEGDTISMLPIERVNNGDTMVKCRCFLSLNTNGGAPAFNVKCYNGKDSLNFVLDRTGHASPKVRQARIDNETDAERVAREEREAQKRKRQDEDDIAMAKRLRASN
jgi:hypothetical protein